MHVECLDFFKKVGAEFLAPTDAYGGLEKFCPTKKVGIIKED